MSQNIDDLLAELEGAEKTAEESFEKALVSEEDEDTVETKEAEAETEESEEAPEETKEAEAEEAEEAEEETKEAEAEEAEESEEEKTASEDSEEDEETEEKTASTDGISEEQLVKIAEDMGKVMARSCYQELVAMGIMPATNDDMPVPPVSEVSMPSESPVTVAADAKEQMGKKASAVNRDTLTNIYNKFYEDQ